MESQHHIAELMEQCGVSFGTSGARGRVQDMTPQVCYAYTQAFLQHLASSKAISENTRVALSGDLRRSTPDILRAVVCAVEDAGYQPVFCGFMPSPAVALYGLQQAIPSIMVTGSHIPDDRNGIKFNRPDGEILKADERAIRDQYVSVPDDITSRMDTELPVVDASAEVAYRQRYRDFFPTAALKGLRVGLYEHSGVGRDLLYQILSELGADVVRLGRTVEFIPVDTEAIRPEDVILARDWTREYALDALVSTDGDADRPLIATEAGEWVRGDVAGVLCGRYLGLESIVTPVSSNSLVEESGFFSQVIRTRIGSPYVIEAMQAELSSGRLVGGYEANGGFLLASRITRDGCTIDPLPTRDAVLVILSLLVECRQRGLALSGLLAALPRRYTASDRLKQFPCERAQTCLQKFLTQDGCVEGAEVEAVFGEICGTLATADLTDGLRLYFENGEIVHLRASGNAPEFRCYNEAHSPERAQALNQACMKLLESWRN